MKAYRTMTTLALALAGLPSLLAGQAAMESEVHAAVEMTAKAGLPEAPVRRAVEEGRARGASEAEIERAALAAHARLAASRKALRGEDRPEPTEAEIVAGAHALLAGAGTADLEGIRGSAPVDRPLTVSLAALASLTARGVEPKVAVEAIARGLRAGADDRSIVDLGAEAASASALGGNAGGMSLHGAVGAGVRGGGAVGSAATVGAALVGGVRGGI